jgi:hypothetical protein
MKFHNPPTNSDAPRGYLIHALHQHAAETSGVIYNLMLRAQEHFGSEGLAGVMDDVLKGMEAEDALS